MGVDQGSFWSQMQGAVGLRDIDEGIVKSLVFGVACSLIAVYEGYNAEPTAAGVGLATTRTVVASSVLTLLLDYVLTADFSVEVGLEDCHMRANRTLEIGTGLFVLLGFAALLFLTTQLPAQRPEAGQCEVRVSRHAPSSTISGT